MAVDTIVYQVLHARGTLATRHTKKPAHFERERGTVVRTKLDCMGPHDTRPGHGGRVGRNLALALATAAMPGVGLPGIWPTKRARANTKPNGRLTCKRAKSWQGTKFMMPGSKGLYLPEMQSGSIGIRREREVPNAN